MDQPNEAADETLPGMGRALVVVEDGELRETARAVLKRNGFAVEVVGSGCDVMASLRALPPRLVLADLHGPDAPGWAVVRAIQQDERLAALPVILMTDNPATIEIDGVTVLRTPVPKERLRTVLHGLASRM